MRIDLSSKLMTSITVGTTPSLRPPSGFLRQALSSELEARRIAAELEEHPVFRVLAASGVIKKLRIGRIRYDRYVSYQLENAVALVKHYKLDTQEEWHRALAVPDVEDRIESWAVQWQIPEMTLRRLLRVLREHRMASRIDSGGRDLSEIAAMGSAVDIQKTIEVATKIVCQYGLSRELFQQLVLTGDYGPLELAERIGCQPIEAARILEISTEIEIANAFEQGNLTDTRRDSQVCSAANEELIAHVALDSDGKLDVSILDMSIRSRYSIDSDRLANWLSMHRLDEDSRVVLERIRALNEWSSTVALIIQTICVYQQAFLVSGDSMDLRPLSNAEVGRLATCHRSVVSRFVGTQLLSTPSGTHSLVELVASRHRVIANISKKHPDWTGRRISEYVSERLGIKLSHRTANYHRQKANER